MNSQMAGEDYKMRNFITYRLKKYYLGDEIKEHENSVSYTTYEGDEKCVQNFGPET
jgi:hypothetical protein